MIRTPEARAAHINGLLRRPYRLGAAGPDAFDCYGLARHLQAALYARELPPFEMAPRAGRFAMAAAIAAHPERARWVECAAPADGALVSMAQQGRGYHLGTLVAVDEGVIVHTLEESGVIAEAAFGLAAIGWHSIKWFVPA